MIKLEGLDINKIKVLNEYYVKNNKEVYCLGERINSADAESFKVKNGYSSQRKDKNRKYEYYKIAK